MSRRVLLTTFALLTTALPASAKMPPFEMKVETQGHTIQTTLILSGDESQIHDFDPLHLDGLLAVFPADQVDDDGRPPLVLGDRTEIPLSRVKPGTYRGRVEMTAGRWAVVPFPDAGWPLGESIGDWYPDTIVVDVSDANAVWPLAVAGAMALLWLNRRCRNARSPLPA